MDKELGKVIHWYDKVGVAVVALKGKLSVGDKIKVKHGSDEFEDSVASMQVDHKDIKQGKSGDEVAIKLSKKAGEGSSILAAE
ncbi:MAG: hypothetical protein A2941_02000 [Candidatus Yanofskybacteria bacterium RIFCSPLOWO2_01_FULL_49_17]|uniref:Translation elongation factor-like protein n=1 Tax=Candidatus Yanofskybacteria bacterium RIFCSPLOWO2_01_FULL_49_17 TaxID=1802700 RepID=A0A1F8GSA4_9BACT|nr:MAG: hypothetical protein A2941_02000 [Candidatus Yanofskybacteria bacterium RIFCSPLOWO2_01_FULL_49_17]